MSLPREQTAKLLDNARPSHTHNNDKLHLLSVFTDCWQSYPWSGWIIQISKLASITEHKLYLSERIRKQLFFTARGYWTADEIVYGAAIVCNLTNKCKLVFPDSTGREQQWLLIAWDVQYFTFYSFMWFCLRLYFQWCDCHDHMTIMGSTHLALNNKVAIQHRMPRMLIPLNLGTNQRWSAPSSWDINNHNSLHV